MNLLNIDWLKQNAEFIHNFGLGFVQVKLSENLRMHFYHPELTDFLIEDSQYRNHRYDFSSTILKGALKNDTAKFRSEEGVFLRRLVSCQLGRSAPESVVSGDLWDFRAEIYIAGNQYFMNDTEFHRVTISSPTITLISRSRLKKDFASIITEVDSEIVCPFSKPKSESECWEIIENVINI